MCKSAEGLVIKGEVDLRVCIKFSLHPVIVSGKVLGTWVLFGSSNNGEKFLDVEHKLRPVLPRGKFLPLFLRLTMPYR